MPKPTAQKCGSRHSPGLNSLQRSPTLSLWKPIYQIIKYTMKPLMFILSAMLLTVLLGGCQTSEEQEQHTNQRRYDAILKQNQKTIDQNQKMMNQHNQ
ncbi:MAG TPA: hypothetical protein VG077_13900 [Verrucomicrobiae bacterium]|nr:hypothetical protein [Verrucomicrobiae bacterium]